MDRRQPDTKVEKLEKPKAEWRKLLPSAAYSVLFEERTEPPFSSPLDKEKRQGTFVCAACYLPLFNSSAKFDSGTGWPSFYAADRGARRARSAITGWSCREPSTTASGAAGTRGMSSTTARHRPDSAGATTASR